MSEKKVRNFIIDTDTASDDAVGIIMALRDPLINVIGMTCVAGNLNVDQCVRNALISIDYADTYAPPVYRGMDRPIIRGDFTRSHDAHGEDGLGDIGYPDSKLKAETKHGIDALIDMIDEYDGDDLEIITLGPLTNIAVAWLKSPDTFKKIKMLTMMGSAGLGAGNRSPVAEANIWADAEASEIVMQSGIPITIVGWDACLGNAVLTVKEIDEIMSNDPSDRARFCIDCNRTLRDLNLRRFGEALIDFADPVAVAVATNPDCVKTMIDAYCYTEYKSERCYGQVVIDQEQLMGKPFNCRVCTEIKPDVFKDYYKKLTK